MQATQGNDITTAATTLCVAFELSKASWKLAFHDGKRDAPAIVTVRADQAQARLDEALEAIEAINRLLKYHLCECRRLLKTMKH